MIRKNKILKFAASLKLKGEKTKPSKEDSFAPSKNISESDPLYQAFQKQKIELDFLREELKKANKETDIAKEKFHNLYDIAPTGYFTFTMDGEITSLNISGARLFGIDRNELISKNIIPFIAQDSRPVFKNFLKDVFAGNTKVTCEIMLSPNNNLPLFVLIEGVLNNYGEKCLATVIDITERKNIESQIIEKEKNTEQLYNFLRRITDNMPDLLWAKDLNNRYTFANKAMCEKLLNAKDTNEPVGRNDMYFANRERKAHPENPHWHTFGEICRDSESIVLGTGKTEHFEEYGNVKNGFLVLDVYKSPLHDDDKNIVGTVGAGRDVTKEKKIEKELLESEELYRKLVSTSPDAITMTDMEGNITFISPKTIELFGHNCDKDILGKHLTEWIAPENLEKGIDNFKYLIKTGEIKEREYVLRKKDGVLFYGEINASIIYAADKNPKGLIIITRDITDRKQVETALKERELKLKELNATKDKFFLHYCT